jgi:hypothetical protein
LDTTLNTFALFWVTGHKPPLKPDDNPADYSSLLQRLLGWGSSERKAHFQNQAGVFLNNEAISFCPSPTPSLPEFRSTTMLFILTVRLRLRDEYERPALVPRGDESKTGWVEVGPPQKAGA